MSCDSYKIVAVPGFGFFSECINNDINNQFQVSIILYNVLDVTQLLKTTNFSATPDRSEYNNATGASRL